MRNRAQENGLILQAIAGTHVVLLGWDITKASLKKGLLGFAIQRHDITEQEVYWLKGMKTFEKTDSGLGPGVQASSHEHPFQAFQWADYSAKPEHEYTYKVVAMYGAPDKQEEGPAISVTVRSESQAGDTHSIYFNRGAVASQEYARRFQNKKPSDVGAPAYQWLSRGLLEALLGFVAQAKDQTFGLYGAMYEFQWRQVLEALKLASDRGATVKVVFDAIENLHMDPVTPNKNAIAGAKLALDEQCIAFTNGKLMHNKFLVLTKNKIPIAVWTGSTNITENGLFGHLNCGHLVEDKHVAKTYFDYWTKLSNNLDLNEVKDWVGERTPTPADPLQEGITEVFSPQHGLATLKRYGELAGTAQRALFMTFAFGMDNVFKEVYRKDDDVLRFALMDKEGNAGSLEKAKLEIAEIRKRQNVIVAVGHNIPVNCFDRWLEERSAVSDKRLNVYWVHTKFMLIDPLGTAPIVITGSANFSESSTNTNHENMLLIRGNQRVADIYMGEFMRIYAHHAFRESVKRHLDQGGQSDDWKPQYLTPDDSWIQDYFIAKSGLALRRLYFSGQ